MNIPKAYTSGFLKTIKLPRMLFILYIANIFTALLIALPFMGTLKRSFDQSAIVSNLKESFDYSTFSDLMYNHGDAIMALLGGIKWLILAYFLLSIFLSGGIIGTYNKDKFTTSNFFGSAAYNFFRFLGLSIIMIVVQIIFFLLVYIPLILIIQSVFDTAESELTLYYIGIGGFIFHFLIFLLISMIGDYAKFYLVLDNSFNFLKGFGKGVKYVFKHFLKTYLLYLFLLFIPAVIMYVYLYFERDIKMATGVGILIVFAMQQVFIFLRCFLRAWVLSSQYQMYAYDFVFTDPVQSVVLKVFEQKDTKTVKKTVEKEQNTQIEPVTEKSEKSSYAIDFNSTFSLENEIKLEETLVTEEEEPEMAEKVVTEEEMIQKINETTEILQNNKVVENHETNSSDTTIDEKIIEEKMIENAAEKEQLSPDINIDQQMNEVVEEKKYSAGETVVFNEDQIEKQMVENQIVEQEQGQNLTDEQMEQQMISQLSNEPGVEVEDLDAEAVLTDEDLDAEAVLTNEDLDGEAVLASNKNQNEITIIEENLDTEAVVSDENLDNEAEIADNSSVTDNSEHHSFETIEQNVIDENGTKVENPVENMKKQNKVNDDHFELDV